MDSSLVKILYIDDESDNLFSFRAMFRRFFSVTTAGSGTEAIQLLSTQSFDVILSDQVMPEMSGLEFCSYVQQNYPHVRRYIVTGYSEMAPLLEAIEVGIILAVIRKPWNMQELKSLIEP